jgi:hypothetical protein
MPTFNGWLIGALAARLRQPGMSAQRRFMIVVCLVLALFLAAAVTFLWRQETEAALEAAALKVFAATGALIVGIISAAVVVRKRRGPGGRQQRLWGWPE